MIWDVVSVIPYVVTTLAPAARAAASSPGGTAAPPSRIVPNRARSAPAASSRRSWVGTSEVCVQPAAAGHAASSSRATTTGVGPPTSDRARMPSPATWLVGSGHSQRSPAPAPIRSRLARAECSSALAASCAPLGSPVDPEVAITTATSPGTFPRLPPWPAPAASGGQRRVPSGVSTAAGAKASSSAATRAGGSRGSSGRIAGPPPSSAAASASSSRPAAAGGSRSACRGRSVTVVRLTGATGRTRRP